MKLICKIKNEIIMACSIMLICVATGCSNDDEPSLGSSINTSKVSVNAVFATGSGTSVVVTKIGSKNFTYLDNGLPDTAARLQIDYEEGTIYDSNGDEYEFAMNTSGFITAAKEYRVYDDEVYEMTATFSYDKSGYINSETESGKCTYYENGKKYTDTYYSKKTFYWSADMIVGIVETSKDYYADEGTTYQVVYEYNIEYGSANPLGQYTCSYASLVETDMGIGDLCYVGLFGYAPSYLITNVSYEKTKTYSGGESSQTSSTNTITYTYSFNNNLTISKETVNKNSNSYSYSTFTSSRGFEEPVLEEWDKVEDENTSGSSSKRMSRHEQRRARKLAL